MKTVFLLLLTFALSKQVDSFDMSHAPLDKCYVKEVSGLTIDERILEVCRNAGIPVQMSELILAQAKLETGNFKSKLFRKHNNMFGMRYRGRFSYTTAVSDSAKAEGRSGYAVYASIEHSAMDQLIYLRYRNLPDTFKTAESFSKALKKKNYFECSEQHYTRALKAHLKKNKGAA